MAQWTVSLDLVRGRRILLPYLVYELLSYAGASGTKTFTWSDVPIALADRFVEPALLAWGPITRALSDDYGGWEVTGFEWEIADVGRELLDLADDAAWRYWQNRVATLYLIDDVGRAAGDTPMTVARGIVHEVNPVNARVLAFSAEDHLATEFSGAHLDELLPRRRIAKSRVAPTAYEEVGWNVAVEGLPEPIIYGAVSDQDLDPAVRRGAVPCYPAGAVDVGGTPWIRFLVAGHACKGIDEVYVDGVAATGRYGVDVLAPGHAGWPHGTPYVDLSGRRYTVIYLIGPDANAAVAGTTTITCDVRGIETVGDGSGDLLTAIYDQWRHWYINFATQDWQTGAWLADRQYPDGTPYTDAASFATAIASIAFRNASQGYPGAGILGNNGDVRSKRDWLFAWAASADGFFGWNRRGQFMVTSGEPATPVATFTTRDDVVDGLVSATSRLDEMRNVIPISFRRDYVANVWGVEQLQLVLAASITGYRRRQEDEPRDLWFVRSAVQADDVGRHFLHRKAHPPRRVRWTTGLHGWIADLGDTVVLSQPDGPGDWSSRAVLVQRVTGQLGEGTVELAGFDTQALDPYGELDITYEPGRTPSGGAFTFGGSSGSVGGGGVTVIGRRSHMWGNARDRGVRTITWVPVPGWLDFRAEAGETVAVRCEVRTDDPGTGVQVRILEVTTDTVVAGPSTLSTSTGWVDVALTFTCVAGQRYRLQVAGSNANGTVYAVGQS